MMQRQSSVMLAAAVLLSLVLRQGSTLAIYGIGAGALVAVLLADLLSNLFGVMPTDPLTFGGVALALIGISMLACYLPVRRAMRVDPMVALRYE
jgi:putative ABC transport system permease protein